MRSLTLPRNLKNPCERNSCAGSRKRNLTGRFWEAGRRTKSTITSSAIPGNTARNGMPLVKHAVRQEIGLLNTVASKQGFSMNSSRFPMDFLRKPVMPPNPGVPGRNSVRKPISPGSSWWNVQRRSSGKYVEMSKSDASTVSRSSPGFPKPNTSVSSNGRRSSSSSVFESPKTYLKNC